MKALVKAKPEVGLWMEDIPMPEYGMHDVLIKIHKTGICGTDIHIYHWNDWAQATIPVPMTVGHEFYGEIVAVGDAVTGLKPGLCVSGEGHIACGHCRNCRTGLQHLCRKTAGVGVNRPGCFAEYLAIPASNVWVLPDYVSGDEAAVLDPFGNAAHTALSFNLLGEDVLITGAGPIGIMASAIARFAGARRIVITDVNDYRLGLAKAMGATHTVNVQNENLSDVVKALDMKEGFDVGLEMSGQVAAMNDMIHAMSHAGKIALLGILPNDALIDWNEVIFKGLVLKGIYGREMYDTWYKMMSMLQTGLDLSPVITHHFAVDDFEQAFQVTTQGQSGKVILEWSK